MKKLRAFTLIELTVVIVIILILSTFVVLNLNGTKKKTRDEKRISDVQIIASALDQYSLSNARLFPPFSANHLPDATDSPNSYKYEPIISGSGIVDALGNSRSPYLDSIPTDPSAATSGYGYIYVRSNDGKKAAVIVNQMETGTDMCNIPTDITNQQSLPDPVRAYVLGSGNPTVSTGLTLAPNTPHPSACYYVAR